MINNDSNQLLLRMQNIKIIKGNWILKCSLLSIKIIILFEVLSINTDIYSSSYY